MAVRRRRLPGHTGGGDRGLRELAWPGPRWGSGAEASGPRTLDRYAKRHRVRGRAQTTCRVVRTRGSGPAGHARAVEAQSLLGRGRGGDRRGWGPPPPPPKPPHLWPASVASPPLGSVSPVTMRNVEVFPAPFTPSRPKHCGCPTDGSQQGPSSVLVLLIPGGGSQCLQEGCEQGGPLGAALGYAGGRKAVAWQGRVAVVHQHRYRVGVP